MQLTLYCNTCEKQLGEPVQCTPQEAGTRMYLAVLSAHVMSPHAQSHRLCVFVDGGAEPFPEAVPSTAAGGKHTLRIVCLQPRCHKQGAELVSECTEALVPAAAVCFHAAHEGHPFALHYKDYRVVSPCKLGDEYVEALCQDQDMREEGAAVNSAPAQ